MPITCVSEYWSASGATVNGGDTLLESDTADLVESFLDAKEDVHFLSWPLLLFRLLSIWDF